MKSLIGSIFSNRYKLIQKLGQGGFATVYLALDINTDENVALKFLHPHYAEDFSYVERLIREAKMAIELKHPNIVRVLSYGSEEDNHFLVMEYVDGKNFAQVLKNQGKLSGDAVLLVAREVAYALDYANKQGIVHRDIKPQNLMLDKDGWIKVADFGIAKVTSMATMTNTGMFVGSPNYISPEQAQGEKVDIRSDIYALGAVLYELIEGTPPFQAETPWSVVHMQITKEPPIIDSSMDDDIKAILSKCLKKKYEERYQKPSELAAEVEALLQERAKSRKLLASVLETNTGRVALLHSEFTKDEQPSLDDKRTVSVQHIKISDPNVAEFSEEIAGKTLLRNRMPEMVKQDTVIADKPAGSAGDAGKKTAFVDTALDGEETIIRAHAPLSTTSQSVPVAVNKADAITQAHIVNEELAENATIVQERKTGTMKEMVAHDAITALKRQRALKEKSESPIKGEIEHLLDKKPFSSEFNNSLLKLANSWVMRNKIELAAVIVVTILGIFVYTNSLYAGRGNHYEMGVNAYKIAGEYAKKMNYEAAIFQYRKARDEFEKADGLFGYKDALEQKEKALEGIEAAELASEKSANENKNTNLAAEKIVPIVTTTTSTTILAPTTTTVPTSPAQKVQATSNSLKSPTKRTRSKTTTKPSAPKASASVGGQTENHQASGGSSKQCPKTRGCICH